MAAYKPQSPSILVPDLNLGDGGISDAIDLTGSLAVVASRVEKMKIQQALRDCESRNAAADALGISARVLAAKMKEHGLE